MQYEAARHGQAYVLSVTRGEAAGTYVLSLSYRDGSGGGGRRDTIRPGHQLGAVLAATVLGVVPGPILADALDDAGLDSYGWLRAI